ncbi:MAG: [Fe-S]-binding protein [Planctomycetales bacterium]|nr:[Fe-S]-binding protein [Planctomycetales bacterium]
MPILTQEAAGRALPRLLPVTQSFPRPRLDDPRAATQRMVSDRLAELNARSGARVAIGVGSRGIRDIVPVVQATVTACRDAGLAPCIVPAMGSHGGGTADGQRGVLTGYGITEEFCGCPIRASMETVTVAQADEGFPVHFDRHAFEAHHVFVCGRIKPHTGFVGDIESGLMKMMLIGLGKHEGAKIYHRAIKDYSFGQIVRSVAKHVFANCRIVAGLGIVENSLDQTAKLEAVLPEQFEEREKALLVQAKQWMMRLPFDRADLLLIDEIGKNISGSGMDTNVVGRKYLDHRAAEHEFPKVRLIALRGLTEATHGNACGIGLAEFCLQRLVDQMDAEITQINCMTGGHPTGAMVPISYATDRQLLDEVLPQIGLTESHEARLMWIANTLAVSEVECSVAYLEEARSRSDLEIIQEPRPFPFDEHGMLPNVGGANGCH